MLNKTQDLNQDLNLDQEQNKDQEQKKPKNFWQRLKRWQKIGAFVLGFILIFIIAIKLTCVLPIPGFELDRSCQKDSDCIPVSCGCLNEKGAKNLRLQGIFCGMYFSCFPPSACVCKNGSCTGIDDWNHYNNSVGLLTDKIEYGREEKIKLTIENTLPEDITFNIISLEVYQNNNWQELVNDIYCDCNAECKKLPLSIEGFMNEEYDWDQKIGLCDNLLLDKKFRFRINLWDNSINRPKMIYYSNEFAIKKIATDISDWQTYRNEEFGFEVKYPEDWERNFKNTYSSFQGSALMENSVAFRPINDRSNVNFEVAFSNLPIKNNDYCLNDKEETIYINSVKAVKCELSLDPDNYKDEPAFGYEGGLGIKVFLSKDSSHNYVIYFKDETMGEYEIVLNQILSTFKFIDQNTNIEDIIKENKKIEYLKDFKFQNLPNYVFPEQKGETYKLENYIFQFIRQPNLNTPLSISSSDIKYKGVLYSKNNGSSWSDFFVIDNPKDYNGNEVKYNPVGMFMKNNKLYLDISDDRGAGSGEGNLLRYYTKDGKIWTRDSCLYLIPELYFNGSDGIDPFTITGNSDCVYSPVSLCDDEPFGTAIGSSVYPIDLKYKKLHFLGQLFTAADCGQERLSQIDGVDGDNYTLGSAINLKNNPSQELVNVFKSIGFNCYDKLSDNECKKWTLDNKLIKISELLKLEPYHNDFSSDDCVNCG